MSVNGTCSPGSHPHADRPNWRPAATIDEYLANCREGLETYSSRRAAKLWGVSRAYVQRLVLVAEIPADLFERLVKGGVTNASQLADIARALRTGEIARNAEHCPHCGSVLRYRSRLQKNARAIFNAWFAERRERAA